MMQYVLPLNRGSDYDFTGTLTDSIGARGCGGGGGGAGVTGGLGGGGGDGFVLITAFY